MKREHIGVRVSALIWRQSHGTHGTGRVEENGKGSELTIVTGKGSLRPSRPCLGRCASNIPGRSTIVMSRGDQREAIFRDDDAAFTGRVLPEVTIRCGLHAEVEYMGRIRSRGEPVGEGRWKLMVHEELHAAASTV